MGKENGPDRYNRPQPRPLPRRVRPGGVLVELQRLQFNNPNNQVKVLYVDGGGRYQGLEFLTDDAAAVSNDGTRIALCDGVSNSFAPSFWATMVARKWVREPLKDLRDINSWIEQESLNWNRYLREGLNKYWDYRGRLKGEEPSSPLPQSKIDELLDGESASTTFLGVEISKASQTIRAVSYGDTCLFLLRNKRVEKSFPYQTPDSFNDFPEQISTDGATAGKEAFFRYRQGQILVMATDAMANYFMKLRDFPSVVDQMSNMTLEQFSQFIQNSRRERSLKTDDSTVIIASLGDGKQSVLERFLLNLLRSKA